MVVESNQPSNDRPFGTMLALLAVCARKGKGKAPSPQTGRPHKGLPTQLHACLRAGFALTHLLREGLCFLGDLGRSRIKKYFLFKYEGGKTCLKKLDLLIRSIV